MFCKGHVSVELSLEIAQYDGRPVIVEWEQVASDAESKLKHRITKIELVMNCLNAQTQSSSPADEEFDDGFDLQERIVSTLRSMSEVL